MKTCSKCILPKDDNCFYPNKLQCKDCIREIREQYYLSNKNDILEYKHEFYQENKSDIIKYKTDYYNNNKSVVRASQNKYKSNRRKTDPSFRLRELVSRAIHGVLGGTKNHLSILDYLPYSMTELKEYLESQFESWMTWDNWGIYDPIVWNDSDSATWAWQIDHVIPQSFFIYTSMSDESFQKCWTLSNLRPYSAKKNVIENNRRATK